MKVHDVIQGSPEWDALRAKHRTGSEASVMMGASSHVTRSQLIHMKATGTEREFSDFVRKMVLDKGHEVEALARPIAEKIIGAELYPATISDDDNYMLVSLDGITMMDDIIWEHKQLNADKVAAIKEGRCPDCDIWQVKQGLLVSGAEKCLYMVSDGTEENCHAVWVTLEDGDAEKLLASWRQFDADLAAYVPTEVKPAAVGRTPETLPALIINVTGMVTASNLDEYKAHALEVIESINTDLQTDQDFADAEKAVKWLKEVADSLKAAKQHALSQTESIDALFRAIDDMIGGAESKRLSLSKLVDAEKTNRRNEILKRGQQALFDHMAELNASLGGKIKLPNIVADFAGVMKNKRTIESLNNAVDTELARVKIEASQMATAYGINLATLREKATGFEFLFNDAQQLVSKANDDLVLLIKSRIADHEAKEAARIEEEVRTRLADEQRKASEQAAEKNRMALSEIQGIQQQVSIAVLGRAGVRKGGTVECIRETLAETKAWPIEESNFGALTAAAQAAKDAAITEIGALLAEAEEKKKSEQEEPDSVKTQAPVAEATVAAPVAAAPAKVVQQAKPASGRPSDAQLRKTIADQFGVTEDKADAWLRDYGFASVA